MENILGEKLRSYIIQNNPDMLFKLQEDFSLVDYVETKIDLVRPTISQLLAQGKPQYIIEEICLEEMTSELRPSKYQFLYNLLEEDFEEDFHRLRVEGILPYEIANLIEVLAIDFENHQLDPSTKEFDSNFRYFILPRIQQYLKTQTLE